ncbi:transcription factor iws1 [Histoplasma capsulatum G186AR]|uniref:Transcription factor iws1 n=1 Tax=Ajellomyces capsulatus (strain G186AR / H82 / ATCC MYA-2454 / RMSCC 2432) TaxID=447093 RepID=C0NJ66_AJECG|nr:transcription factor iws1 [Histoplasma capsulatum G186AR]EEH07907.1 transcription factor iws1 [Histoplasma capsulatum G186AR]
MSASPEPAAAESPLVDKEDDSMQHKEDDIAKLDLSDDESVLSDVDDAQFEDFDAANVSIDERPAIAIDEENLKLIGRHKRARNQEEEEQRKKKKSKEGRREKKSRRRQESDDAFSGGEEIEGKRARKRREDGEKRSRKIVEEINEEDLDPAARMSSCPTPAIIVLSRLLTRGNISFFSSLIFTGRRRALDRMMDEQLKKPTKRRARKADGIDLADLADAEIEDVRRRMTDAAKLDSIARKENRPAMHKLKMLPEVVSLLNRNQYVNSLVDPEINLLEAVKFFLEPLDDGSLPAYNIQRDLLAALGRLPINKETLIASGIGRVIVFYTKSKRPEIGIKRQAERLLAEWTRPILQRSDDYSKRVYEEAYFDPSQLAARNQGVSAQATAAEARARELLPPRLANRARVEAGHTSYTIVPRSTTVQESRFARPLGASGEDRFRRMKARQAAAMKASKR